MHDDDDDDDDDDNDITALRHRATPVHGMGGGRAARGGCLPISRTRLIAAWNRSLHQPLRLYIADCNHHGHYIISCMMMMMICLSGI